MPTDCPDSQRPVHPHRRGEHPAKKMHEWLKAGSSPQAWGTSFLNRVVTIPAVHPHRRGEHNVDGDLRIEGDGSSPQAWGTLYKARFKTVKSRFIPTGVGNMVRHCVIGTCQTVHPHRRGEHGFLLLLLLCCHGSSPQAWGT